jgi:iron complex transport system ATP-binding protein
VSAIEVRDLSVRAGRRTLIDGVTLDVEAGSWCTVIGPNGAGKTTLVESVAGLRPVATGSVTLNGEAVGAMGERRRAAHVALVPQHPVAPPGMSVEEYVALGRTPYHGALRGPGPKDRRIVAEVIERLELAGLRERAVATLSGGERQRAVLARAVAQSTPVVVLDEPTTGLDLRHQVTLLELLGTEVRECGLCVLATLHDLTLAGQFADRLVLMNEGRVLLDGPSRDVVRDPLLGESYQMALRVVEVDGADVVVPAHRGLTTG